jgi:imidazolonepropionase-like amidohydrolase
LLAPEELSVVVQEAHRRGVRVTVHSRGAGSTKAAAEAGMDWILHADLATDAELEVVAETGVRLMPTMTFLRRGVEVGPEYGRGPREMDMLKRHWESAVHMLERARALGIIIMCGTDSGNSPLMPYGQLHANEAEILVGYGGYTPMEAIVATTRNTAFALGLEDDLGTLAPGKLADIIMLRSDPLGDIRALQGGEHLTTIIKDGRIIPFNGHGVEEERLAFAQPTIA